MRMPEIHLFHKEYSLGCPFYEDYFFGYDEGSVWICKIGYDFIYTNEDMKRHTKEELPRSSNLRPKKCVEENGY